MVTYFHRNLKAGFSINKVTQTIVSGISKKKEYYMPHASASLRGICENLLFVYKHRNNTGINHITGDIHYCILSLIHCKSVLTIHDTVSLDYSKQVFLKRIITEFLWFRLPIMLATKIVCISEATKQMVAKYTNRTDLVVIHNAIDPSLPTILKDYSIQPYRILFIGTAQNKNLYNTALALKDIECHLRIIGRLSDEQVAFLNSTGIRYSNVFNLTDSQIIKEYEDCDLVSFVSLFEGFGMPIIEANKVGRPVITSDIPVLHEVAGNSAVFVNPLDIDDMRHGFIRLFSEESLRKECIERGLENVKRFDINVIRNEWIKLYNTL